jgi:ketosteroid isomerase-like protein
LGEYIVNASIRSVLHPNVQFVIDAHEKLERRDMDAIPQMFLPNIVWHEFGSVDFAGAYVGIADVMAFWKVYFEAAGNGFQQDILEIMANDSHVCSIVRLTGIKPSIALNQTAADIMRIEEGKIAEFWRYYADTAAAHAFMLAPP